MSNNSTSYIAFLIFYGWFSLLNINFREISTWVWKSKSIIKLFWVGKSFQPKNVFHKKRFWFYFRQSQNNSLYSTNLTRRFDSTIRFHYVRIRNKRKYQNQSDIIHKRDDDHSFRFWQILTIIDSGEKAYIAIAQVNKVAIMSANRKLLS